MADGRQPQPEPKGAEIPIELHDEDPVVTDAWKFKGNEGVTGRDTKST